MENISYLEPASDPKATLTIYYSDSTTDNCMRSLAYAHERSDAMEDTILYLNTGQTERQLHAALRAATGGAVTREGNLGLRIITSPLGELAFKREALAESIRQSKVTHILINSWEFAAKDARSRNILIHTLLYFIDVFDVSVTICSQQGEGAMRGHITRGKLGRISAFADSILPLQELPLAKQQVQAEIPEPKLPEPELTTSEITQPEEPQPLPPTPIPEPESASVGENGAVIWQPKQKKFPKVPYKTEMRDGKRYLAPVEVDTYYTDENGKPAFKTRWMQSNVEV